MSVSKVIQVLFISIFYLILSACVFVWGLSYNSWELKEQLKWVSPLVLEINFFLILVGLIINLGAFRNVLGAVSRRSLVMLLTIAVGATLIAAFVAPKTHRIFYDEDIYLNIAQNIANLKKAGMCNEGGNLYGEYFCDRLEYNKEPSGWPYLASVLFRIVGTSHRACFLMNNIFWGLSVLVVFFTGFLLFRDERAGLFGSLLFGLIPEGLIWSNTTAVEPSATLLAGIALLSVVFFVKNPEGKALFLAVVLVPFACQFRPESALIVLPAAFILVSMKPKELLNQRFYAFTLVLLILLTPHLLHLYAVKGEGWGAAGGRKFALIYLNENFWVNSLFYIKNNQFPLLVTILFFVGIGLPRFSATRQSFLWKEKGFLLSWFVTFWGIFLIFYAGSYKYGADVRFSLVSYIPMAILAGFGAAELCKRIKKWSNCAWASHSLAALVLLSATSFFPYIRAETQEAWAARADHRFAQIMAKALPPDSLILTHNPNMFLLWGKNASQASIATENGGHMGELFARYKGGVYFHFNFWCNVNDPLQNLFCRKIFMRFKTTEMMAFTEGDYRYAIYKLDPKGTP